MLIDVQWSTPHLESLGVRDIPRDEYLDRLATAVALPGPVWHAGEATRRSAGTEGGNS
ncbi:MAG: hypothetical protein R2716_01730 [Microthrixaceae bacterium]